MPDLTEHVTFTCRSNLDWSTMVNGYSIQYGRLGPGAETEFGFTCTCPAFKFGKGSACKHILAAKHFWCGWNRNLDLVNSGSLPRRFDGTLVCPDCGGPLEPIKIAI